MLKRVAILVAVLLASLEASAQYVQVKTKLFDGSGNVVLGAYLHFQLMNCGVNFPSLAGSGIVVKTTFDLKQALSDGTIAGQVIGNDQVLCGGVASTFYHITPMRDPQNPLAPGQDYVVCSALASPSCYPGAGFWDASIAQPMSSTPASPGFQVLYANPTLNQIWNQPLGTSALFFGVFDFRNATVLGLGSGGSGSVQASGCGGALAYYVNPTALLNGDCNTNLDANGNLRLVSVTTTDATHAGAYAMVEGPTPVLPAHSFQWAGAASVVAGGIQFKTPGTLPLANQALCAASVLGQVVTGGWCNTSGGGSVLLAPSADQTVVQPDNGSGKTTSLNVNNLNSVRIAQQFNWSRTPGSPSSLSVGSNTVTLAPCPEGIDTSNNVNVPYYVYVATTGTAEAVTVTGGTCTAGAASGTIIFTAVNTHSAGYTVQSASAGIQEALNDAGSPNSRVEIAPTGANAGALQIYAPTFIAKNKLLVDAYGAHLQCWTRSYCLHVGDLANANDFNDIRIHGLRVDSMVNVDGAQVTNIARTSNVITVTTAAAHSYSMTANAGGPDVAWLEWYPVSANIVYYHGMCTLASVIDATHFTCTGPTGSDISSSAVFGWTALENAGIEDNADATTMADFVLRVNGSNRFHYVFVIDNDQSAAITGYKSDASGVRCTANFCGWTILGRVDGGSSSVLYVRDSELSLQCAGNGIKQLSGNSLHVSDTVIQGFAQTGILYEAGLQSVLLDNVYEEAGGCTNPVYPGSLGAQAGVVHRGQTAVLKGNSPLAGLAPTFASGAGTQRNYYIVPRSANLNYGPILYAGSGTAASGTVTVAWPQIPSDNNAGAITYDVLYTTGNAGVGVQQAPYTAHATSLTTGVTSAACADSICTFSDTLAAGSAYTVNAQQFIPNLLYWPAGIVASGGSNNPGGTTQPVIIADMLPQAASAWGITGGFLLSLSCGNTASVNSAVWVQCLDTGPNAASAGFAWLVQQQDASNNGPSQTKGRINLQFSPNAVPFDVLTLADTKFDKTRSTSGHRPTYDAADCALGFDQGGGGAASAGVALRCGAAISYYINSLPDNSSYLERLVSNLKTFKVPVQITAVAFASLPTCNGGAEGTSRPVTDSTTNTNGATISGGGASHVNAFCNGTNWLVESGTGSGSGLADPGGNGLVVRTALNTTTNRSLATADSTHVTVANADGTAGNPTVDIGTAVALLASPAFTGTPTVPTAAAGTSTTQAASTAFVTSALALLGVQVNAQSGNYTLNTSPDRAAYLKFSGGTTATLTLCQIASTCANNFPFVLQNLNSGNLTVTANAADKIDNSATGGSITVLPNFAAFVYQDSSSAPGNWWSIQIPNFAAFGATGSLCSWSTSTGWSCGNATGDVTTAGSKATTLASLNVNATAADYVAGGGTAQAQTATFSPALTANTTGAHGRFLPVAANTAADPTLAASGLTAKTVKKCGSVPLVAGDLSTSQQAYVDYDGTNWVLENPQAIPCGVGQTSSTVFWQAGGSTATSANAANSTKIWALGQLPGSVISTTKLFYNVATADNSANVYNIAIFNSAGNIVCQTGATAGTTLAASTGEKMIAWTGACGPLLPSLRYYVGVTGNAATMVLAGQVTGAALCATVPSSNFTTASAVWTTPIGIPADSVGTCTVPQVGLY